MASKEQVYFDIENKCFVTQKEIDDDLMEDGHTDGYDNIELIKVSSPDIYIYRGKLQKKVISTIKVMKGK